MTLRKKIYFTVFATIYFVAVLLLLAVAAVHAANETGETANGSVSGPEQHDKSLISVAQWVIDGEVVGMVAAYVYNDITSEKPVDYWELYDNDGDLLAVSWFDKFGIQRNAIDRGVVEEGGKLEGVFIIVSDGSLI